MEESESVSTSPWFKNPQHFVPRVGHPPGSNLEARLEHMFDRRGDLLFHTPIERFFVRNNSTTVEVDAANHRLVVAGDAVASPLSLSMDDLAGFETAHLDALVECGGDHRAFFTHVQGQEVDGDPWHTGGIGLARWSGVRLADVLERAGLTENAAHVLMVGIDRDSPEGGWRRPVPLAKALDPDTLLATHMNGEPLPPDHGFPVRAVVPGWVGANSIKWLGRIEVSAEPFWVRNNTTRYVLVGDAYPPEGRAKGKIATHHSLNSALALPWEACFPQDAPEGHLFQGYAWAPGLPVTRVEWRADRDDDETGDDGWREAELRDEPSPYAWRRFRFRWTPPGDGRWVLRTRATDADGNRQPDTVPYNRHGYLFNVPVPHPVLVE